MRLNHLIPILAATICFVAACGGTARESGPPWSPQPAPPPPAVVALVHGEQAGVSMLNTVTGEVVGRITLPSPLGPVALNHDATALAAAVPGGIAIVDVGSRKILRTLPFSAEISSLAFAGDVLYVLDPHVNEGKVSALSIADGKVLRQNRATGLGTSSEVSVDGRRLFVGHQFYSGFVTVFETSTLRELASVRVEDGVRNLVVSPDERWLFAPNGMGAGGRLTIVDTTTNLKAADIDVPGQPGDVAVFEGGTRALVPQFSERAVTLIDLTSRRILRSIAVTDYPTNVVVSPDGAWAYVAHNGTTPLSVIALKDGTVRTIDMDPPVSDIIRPSRSAGAK